MSDQDRFIREAQLERKRMLVDARMLWMSTRHSAGLTTHNDKQAVKTVAVIVERVLRASRDVQWGDINAGITAFAKLPIGKDHYRSIWDLEHAIGDAAQDRRQRERSRATTVDRAQANVQRDERAAIDLAELRARHPGMSVREMLQAEGLDPFSKSA